MTQIDTQILMAYADGELSAAEQADVEAALQRDPLLQQQLQQLNQLDSLLGAAFNQPLHDRQPELRAMAEPFTLAKPSKLTLWPALASNFGRQVGAAAALLVLGVAIGGWYQSHEAQNRLIQQQAQIEQTINQALENHLSGDGLQWSSHQAKQQGSITPVRTYRSQQGQFCREFIDRRQLEGLQSEQRGVACRSEQGWQIKANYYL